MGPGGWWWRRLPLLLSALLQACVSGLDEEPHGWRIHGPTVVSAAAEVQQSGLVRRLVEEQICIPQLKSNRTLQLALRAVDRCE